MPSVPGPTGNSSRGERGARGVAPPATAEAAAASAAANAPTADAGPAGVNPASFSMALLTNPDPPAAPAGGGEVVLPALLGPISPPASPEALGNALERPSRMGGSALLAAMLATLGGCFALLLGIAVLLLPLLTPELSRPRDAFWGAVVLLLGLVLVTSAERLTGAPMLAVLCGGLLIGRLGSEVGQGRWNQLSGEERSALATPQRWVSGLQQLSAASARLLLTARELGGGLASWLAARRQPKASGKRWVRPEAEVEADREAEGAAETPPTGALRGTGPDNTSEEPAATSSPSPPAQHEPSAQREPADHLEPSDQQGPAEGFSGPDQPAGLAAEAAAALQAMPSPQAPDPAPASEAEAETETETVEVEILDPPPPQRSVPDFHAIDALLRASGALPSPGPAEPPLAEAELEPEDGFRGA